MKPIMRLLLLSMATMYPSVWAANIIHDSWAKTKRLAQCTFAPKKYNCSAKEAKNARIWAASATVATLTAAAAAIGIAIGAQKMGGKETISDDSEIQVTYQNALEGPPFGTIKITKAIWDGVLQGNDAALTDLKSKITENVDPGTNILLTPKGETTNKIIVW